MGEPAGVWLRVSTGGQDEQSQVPDVMAWAGSHGYEVRRTYTVHGKSAWKGDHAQALAEMLEDMRAGVIRVLVVWKSDRIERRGPRYAFNLIHDVRQAGGRIEFVTETYLNATGPAADLMTANMAVMAEQESKTKSDRVKARHGELRDKGSVIGRSSWGLVVTGPKGDKALVPTETGRRYAPQVFARIVKGESLGQVARWLDSAYYQARGPVLGIGVMPAQLVKLDPEEDGPARLSPCPAGGSWWPRTVGTLVRNPVYAGFRCAQDPKTRKYGATLARCEALVDMATFKRAGLALDARAKRGPIDPERRAMLAGVLFCPRCGGDSPMYRLPTRGGTVYYRCTGRGPDRKGCGNMIPLNKTDAMVQEIAEATFAWRKVTVVTFIPGHDHAAELEEIKFRIKQLGTLDLADSEYDRRLAELRAERDRVAELPSVPDRTEETETGQTYADLWAGLEPSQRGAWLKAQGFRVEATRERLRLSQPGKPGQPAVEVTADGVTFAKADLKAAA